MSSSDLKNVAILLAIALAFLLIIMLALRVAGVVVTALVAGLMIAFFAFAPKQNVHALNESFQFEQGTETPYAQETAVQVLQTAPPPDNTEGPVEAGRYVIPPEQFGDAIAEQECVLPPPTGDPGFVQNPDKNPGWIDTTAQAMHQIKNDTWRQRMYTKDINALVMARSMLLGDERPVTNLAEARRNFDVMTHGNVKSGRYCKPLDPSLITRRYRPFYPPQPNLVKRA